MTRPTRELRSTSLGSLRRHRIRSAYEIVKAAYRSWSDHRAIRIGAGLGYYWLFAAVPLATLALQLAAVFFSTGDIASWVLERIAEVAEETGSVELQVFVEGLINRTQGMTVSVVGAVVAAVSASFALAATQDAMNMVWDSPKVHGLAFNFRRRLLLMVVAVAVAALLIVALLTIAIVGAVDDLFPGRFADQVVGVLSTVAPFLIGFGLIALSFRYMPRPSVPWRPVAIAAGVTVGALAIATFGYAVYLDVTRQTTLAGAAATVLVTLVWFYLLAQVFVAGGVLTRAIHEHALAGRTDTGAG